MRCRTDPGTGTDCLRAGRIAAAEAELLPWIAEFDRREGWAGTGLLSCAHWLSWRIGLSLPTAREQVRVARRLEDLPALAAAFSEGRVSHSKVRAITRVAESHDGIDWVEHARHSSAAQLEMLVRRVRRARANELAEQDPGTVAHSLRTRTRYNEDGSFSMTISGPAELLPVVQAGLDAKKAELQRQRDAAQAEAAPRMDASAEAQEARFAAESPAAEASTGRPEREDVSAETSVVDPDAQVGGWPTGTSAQDVREAMASFFDARDAEGTGDIETATPARRESTSPTPDPEAPARVTDAEALLALAQDALLTEQTAHPTAARRRRTQLVLQVDPLSGWARQVDGELLPPSSLRATAKSLPGRCTAPRLRPLIPADLRRLDLGRSHREANAALRELLGTVDGERCRFPGCTRRKKLHAHHVRFWSDGGATDLDNLVLVCARHHTLIHSQGFQLVLHPDRRLEVRTAAGAALLHHPAPVWGDPTAMPDVSAEALPPDHCDGRLDPGYAVSVLLAQAV